MSLVSFLNGPNWAVCCWTETLSPFLWLSFFIVFFKLHFLWYVYLICDILSLFNWGVPKSHLFMYYYITHLFDGCLFFSFFSPPLSDGNSRYEGKENHAPMITPVPSKRRRLGPPEGCKVEIREAGTPILHLSLKEQQVLSLWPCTYLAALNNLTKRFSLSVLGSADYF